ncbi:MAG: PD40 domain-containing protein [Candidatus Aminicenantes bacterium]|nr:PD40 domain-containing protein [Candidatus Aminicenantes bacterium]
MAVLALLLLTGFLLNAGEDFSVLKGPYLGQMPPGMTPEIFAPGIVSTDAPEGSSGFVMGGTAFLFQRFVDRDCHTYITTRKGDPWSPPERIPFWKELIHNGDFVIAPDDHTLLYQVKQERAGRLESNIWEVRLNEDGWGPRSALPAPINTEYDESNASRAANGNLYFFSNRPGGKGQFDLYMAECKHGGYPEPINLQELNTAHHEWDPFIAPDESYLVFCSTRPGGLGQDDLYISFRDREGRWCEPVHLDDRFNSPRSENRPYVPHDGRFLFFTSSREGNRDIYWVDARIIEEIKAGVLK